MIISDHAVETLRRYADRKLTTGLHPEVAQVYTDGLQDGCAMLAEIILAYVQDEPTGDKANA